MYHRNILWATAVDSWVGHVVPGMDFATTHDIDTKQFTILYKSVVMGITIQEEESTAYVRGFIIDTQTD